MRLLALLVAGALSFLSGLLCGDHVMGWPRSGQAQGVMARGPGDAPAQAGAASSPAADPARLLPPPGEFQNQAALIVGCNEMVRYCPVLVGQIATALHRNIQLIGLVSNQPELEEGRRVLARFQLPPDAMRFVVAPVNSLWVRDYVPMFARRADGSALLADFLYEPPAGQERRLLDDAFGKVLGKMLDLPVQAVPLAIEGGNLVTNGQGLVVTTESLVPRNAARGYDAPQIEKILDKSCGYTSWARVPGLIGEPTQHADMFMTFLASDVVVVGKIDPAVDPQNAALLDGVAQNMAALAGPRGPMKVHRIPMPVPVKAGTGWRTYTNIVLANGVMLVPMFKGVDQALQTEALELYARLMPDWKVVGINCDELARHEGLLHCVTRQVPSFVPLAALLRSAAPVAAASPAPAAPAPAPLSATMIQFTPGERAVD